MTEDDDFARLVARERHDARARRWRAARVRLRLHLWVFTAVNIAMLAGWATQGLVFGHGHPPWFAPVTVGWSMGLAVHAAGIRRLQPHQ